MNAADEELLDIMESKPEQVKRLARDLRQEFIVRQRKLLENPVWRLPTCWDKDELWEKTAACAISAGADARTYIEVCSGVLGKPGQGFFANALSGNHALNSVKAHMTKVRNAGRADFENAYFATQTRIAESASGTSAEADWDRFLNHLQSYHPLPAPVARIILSRMDPLVLKRYKDAAIRELDGKPEFESRLKSTGIDIRAF